MSENKFIVKICWYNSSCYNIINIHTSQRTKSRLYNHINFDYWHHKYSIWKVISAGLSKNETDAHGFRLKVRYMLVCNCLVSSVIIEWSRDVPSEYIMGSNSVTTHNIMTYVYSWIREILKRHYQTHRQ